MNVPDTSERRAKKNARNTKWRKNRPETVRRYKGTPEYRARNREWSRLRRARFTPEEKRRVAETERNRRLVNNFGITAQQYDAMLAEQNGVCAICRKTDGWVGHPSRGRLHVDHDHVTGRVRGLLCSCCNVTLGSLSDDPERIERMLEYVRRARV